jgi:hypothetical protein
MVELFGTFRFTILVSESWGGRDVAYFHGIDPVSGERVDVQPAERADVEYLRVLHLAASTMERPVEDALAAMLDAGEPLSFDAVHDRVAPIRSAVPVVEIPPPDLGAYDRLLGVGGAA